MSISFNEIPVNIRVPGTYVEIDNSQAIQGLLPMPSTALMFGQMRADGTAVAGQPVRVTRAGLAPGLFGVGSMLAGMVSAFFDANGFVPLTVVPVADDSAAGVASSRTLTVDSGPTATGTLSLYIGGRRIQVRLTAGTAAADAAATIASAITADTGSYLIAEPAAAVITLTAKNTGLDVGNIDVRHSYYQGESLPSGMALTISDLTPGAGNPDIQPVIDALGDTWYTTMVMPWTDAPNLRALTAELADRFGPIRQLESHAFAAVAGTVSEVATAGEAQNSPHLTFADAGQTISPSWLMAAADAGIDAGEPDPARPRQTLVLPAALLPAPETEQRTWAERNTLLHSGIATHTITADGFVAVERLITTYQGDTANVENPSYLDVTTLRTVMYMRYTVRARVANKYPRSKLADDGTPVSPGSAIVTPSVMRGELISLANDWAAIGIVEDLAQFKRDLLVERNATDRNRLDAVIPPNVINQLRVFAGQIQFRL
ncbi:MAG: phage tail sheath subtilisin-like domain-containing protein [Salinisphaera sp.]|jgi:phage tail sheath gpL-like|nr:phage tail sheath subtilisin-like domain-containing protein [Salinisphaera sp.]